MEDTGQLREADIVRDIAQFRIAMNRHDLSFEQAAAVIQLSALDELLCSLAREPGANET